MNKNDMIPLKDIIKIKHGYAFKGEYFTANDTGLLVVTPGNFKIGGGFQETDKFYDSKDFPSEYILKANDLIVTMTDLSKNIDTIGYGALVPENNKHKYLHNQRIGLVEITDKRFLKEYIYWIMRWKHYQRFIAGSSNGATVHHTSPERIYKYKLKLRNIDEQTKIVKILSSYDLLIENNNKRISILDQMAEEIYKEWFTRFRFPGYKNAEFENGIPKGWQVKKVKDCVKRMNFGITYKADELEKEGTVIVIDQSKDEYLGFHNNEPSHKADLDNPIMLFGDHSCKTKIMIKDFSLGENVIPYISVDDNEINNYYLYYATKRLIETEEYKRHWSRFCGFKILVPPIVLQNKFMQYIKMMEQEKELLWQENQNLIKQRDLLLPRLMSGKLEVK